MKANTKNKPEDLVLVLDGRVMKGLKAGGLNTSYQALEFDLKRLSGADADSVANRAAWAELLSRSESTRRMAVGVAFGRKHALFRGSYRRFSGLS
jgi:hypothetical protein